MCHAFFLVCHTDQEVLVRRGFDGSWAAWLRSSAIESFWSQCPCSVLSRG